MIQKLIDANELKRDMCRKCIDTDGETEKGRAKWDSGLWIRYKVFEDAIALAPTVEAIPIEWIKEWVNNYCDWSQEQLIECLLRTWNKNGRGEKGCQD